MQRLAAQVLQALFVDRVESEQLVRRAIVQRDVERHLLEQLELGQRLDERFAVLDAQENSLEQVSGAFEKRRPAAQRLEQRFTTVLADTRMIHIE